MTLQETKHLIERLIEESTSKSEIKIFDRFKRILSNLIKKSFSQEDLQSIESKLDDLGLDAEVANRKKHFKKSLSTLEKYLKTQFFLTPKGHYQELYGGLGMTFGLVFGLVFLSHWDRSMGIALGLTFGMSIGILLGSWADNKAEKEDRVI